MSRIYISKKAYAEIKLKLAEAGHCLAYTGPCESVSEPLYEHPDIFMCKLGTLPISPVFHGRAGDLGTEYPADVLYNSVVTERFMICNTNTVSSDILERAEALYPDIRIINVKQGYTKCNVIPVDDSHFITEDRGIYKKVSSASGAECLLISPGHVMLPGYKNGFIGGCSGRIANDIWFNGDITEHPDSKEIAGFIKKCGLDIKYISGRPLMDIGSIIEEII